MSSISGRDKRPQPRGQTAALRFGEGLNHFYGPHKLRREVVKLAPKSAEHFVVFDLDGSGSGCAEYNKHWRLLTSIEVWKESHGFAGKSSLNPYSTIRYNKTAQQFKVTKRRNKGRKQ